MLLNRVFVLFSLVLMVKGAWWAFAAQPVILGLGAILGVLNMDVFDAKPISWDLFIPSFNQIEKK